MPENSEGCVNSYEVNTVGGRAGHLLRRAIHISMILIPIAYHYWGDWLCHLFDRPNCEIILIALVIVVIVELVRIKKRYLIVGQRAHEATHVSSFAWGAMAMACVLLLVPNTLYAIPIVAGCAVGDPLIGALKCRLPWYVVRGIACLVIGFIWWVCSHFMPLPVWFPWVISIITVLVEWPNLSWIDDNALMQLAPLAVLLWVV